MLYEVITLQGLIVAVDNLDEVLKICRESKNMQEIKIKLQDRFDLSEIQAEAIALMRLYQISSMERQKIIRNNFV